MVRTDQNQRAEVTAREVALRRQLGEGRRRRRRLPRQQYPGGVARDYAKVLVGLYHRATAGLVVVRERMPEILGRVRAQRERVDANEGEEVRRLFEVAEEVARNVTNPVAVQQLAREWALRTSTFQRIQLSRQVRAALGVDVFAGDQGLNALFELWAAENAALIRSVPTRVVEEVSLLSQRAVAGGQLWGDLAKEIERRVGIGETRAKLIARDQVGKLYGQVNAQRLRNLGVRHFIWRTVKDRRVRGDPSGAFPKAKPSHYHLEGQRFPLNEGAPGVGLPGEPILCRCYAEPDFAPILGASG